MKRHKLGSKASKAQFSSTASKTHWRNIAGSPMRGGIRL